MKKVLPIILVVVLVGGGLALYANNRKTESANSSGNPNTASSAVPEESVASTCPVKSETTVTITYTSDREFSPACVNVKSGTKIVFDNQSGKDLEVGTDPHPVHTGNRQVSNGEFVLEVLANAQGDTTVSTAGTFGYHDHVNASATGTIVVQ